MKDIVAFIWTVMFVLVEIAVAAGRYKVKRDNRKLRKSTLWKIVVESSYSANPALRADALLRQLHD
ncbi:hypothetical protein QA649_03600 [Bradyrhizobium sp. CB1717]|uniref:hypothetical protein n=1 Tax=Bradyrhizobium sp. CB1717 TaxID=3039154 RepID=UPI0024B27B9E|nr:hypothetical protein [Bradyrhizobium sp. CB1717]WFU25344.1 hypothetical protein QA649_03600 [Bradyrhizobium sp. CB1717]